MTNGQKSRSESESGSEAQSASQVVSQPADAQQQAEQQRKRRKQARVMNTLNVPMRRVLGLPIATPLGKRLMLAYIVGRKSGRLYRQPLSYVRDGDTLLTPGGGKWKLNLDPAKPVRLRIRGRDVQARPEVVRDQDEVVRLLGVMEAGNPAAGRFIPLPKGPDGKPEPQALAQAIKYGFCIVRWHLDDTPAAS